MAKLSPMLAQYLELKNQNPDCFLFFRLGDFYELFFEDAQTVAPILSLTLTGRDCGLEKRAPMCGVPHHSVTTYINKLISLGYKVAICEQLEDPAECKGLVKRGVTRIITPGTVIEDTILDEKENNYIVSCMLGISGTVGICYCDVSTGAFNVLETSVDNFRSEIERIHPREIICMPMHEDPIKNFASSLNFYPYIHSYVEWAFDFKSASSSLTQHFKVANLAGFGIKDMKLAVCAAGALMDFLNETQKNSLEHISKIKVIDRSTYMALDWFTKRNLELTETLRGKDKKGSLLWLLDKTKTSMGARTLKDYIEQPFLNKADIEQRLEAVDEIFSDIYSRSALRLELAKIYDIERLISSISYNTLDAKKCITLKKSLEPLPRIKEYLSAFSSPVLKECHDSIDTMDSLYELLENAIADEPASGIKDGGIIKEGFNVTVDELRDATKNGHDWVKKLEAREKEATGIKNLKIKYNKVFGYYIEVTNSYLSQVPYGYVRKQTLVGSERFITEELKQLEETIVTANDKCIKLEYELFVSVREKLRQNIERLQKTAYYIAQVDALQALAQVAYDNNYVRPKITEDGIISINNGRHPVVERTVSDNFVPNDALLDTCDNNVLIITGPNMAGKSTYMRQTALITLMAHMGSFVPADSASICTVDKIFTRVGASDDLAAGQSTFMVEMNELASILNNATSRSLLILDEIGRGTGTKDGLSIARACVDYIVKDGLNAKTLFATHYHELTEIESFTKGVKNYSVYVNDSGEDVVFLHKIVRGGADKSFGIEVAKLAGLPQKLLLRAKTIMNTMQDGAIAQSVEIEPIVELRSDVADIIKTLKETDADNLTPLEAMSLIYELKRRIKD